MLVCVIRESGTMFLDAVSLNVYPINEATFFRNGIFEPVSEMDEAPDFEPTYIRTDVEQRAISELTSMFTRTVSYASNDRTNTCTISPSKSNIELSRFRMLYFPVIHVNYTLFSRPYITEFFYNGKAFLEKSKDYCPICGAEPVHLCCSCGKLFCGDHARQCTICKRLACDYCISEYKAGLFRSSLACKDCREKHPRYRYRS